MESESYDNEQVEETSSQYESDSSVEAQSDYEVEDGKNFKDEVGLKRISCINSRLEITRALSVNFLKPMKNLEEFIEISKCLCLILPKVSQDSLFEVDNLLYNEVIKGDDNCLTENKDLYHHIDASLYNHCYIAFMKEGVRNVFMDAALMKLAEHMPVVFDNWACQCLLILKDVYSTCVALKIMVASANNKVEFDFEDKRYCDEIQLYMEYLKQIPQGYSPNGKKLSDFISQHAALYHDLTKYANICVDGFHFIKVSIVKMIRERFRTADKYILCLIDTFMKFNSSERDQLPNYLFELMKGTDESVQEALKSICHPHDAKGLNNFPQKLMRIIFDNIITNIYNLGREILKNYEEKMELIDAVYGYKIEPYFTCNENEYFSFNKPSMSIEDVKDHVSDEELQSRKLSYEKEDHIIFQKFFIYDVFMRSLHCLSIFHELFMELEQKFNVGYPQSYVYYNFWVKVPMGGLAPWYIKMIVMKCPFLLKSRECDIIFNDITSEEKEFIDNQIWKIKISKKEVDNKDKHVDTYNGAAVALPSLMRDCNP